MRALVDFYMENARSIRDGLAAAGFTVYGGRNAPYIWIRMPAGHVVLGLLRPPAGRGARGRRARRGGFGPSGEGYFRLTAFGSREQTEEAVARIKSCRR